jgi:hypothetical protein
LRSIKPHKDYFLLFSWHQQSWLSWFFSARFPQPRTTIPLTTILKILHLAYSGVPSQSCNKWLLSYESFFREWNYGTRAPRCLGYSFWLFPAKYGLGKYYFTRFRDLRIIPRVSKMFCLFAMLGQIFGELCGYCF